MVICGVLFDGEYEGREVGLNNICSNAKFSKVSSIGGVQYRKCPVNNVNLDA